jgi:hypothetical protein
VSPTGRSEQLWVVPELGPSLGRLVDPPPATPGALGVPLGDLRVELVSRVFDLAGAARSFAASGDHAGAIASLGRVAWLGLWEKTVAAAAERIAVAANRALESAAEESRFPARRLRPLRLTDDDTRAIGARLGSGGAPFVAALDALERNVHATGSARGRDAEGAQAWRTALGAVARRLESAWLALEDAARREEERWGAEVARVRAWRRPVWPLWLVTALAAGAAVWLGLILGGYVPTPPALEGLAAFWWARP